MHTHAHTCTHMHMHMHMHMHIPVYPGVGVGLLGAMAKARREAEEAKKDVNTLAAPIEVALLEDQDMFSSAPQQQARQLCARSR